MLICALAFLCACEANYSPKPFGYFRIDFPAHRSYHNFSSKDCPFSFEVPDYAIVIRDSVFLDTLPENLCWLNIAIPDYNGQIHLSYKSLERNELRIVLEDMHKLTSKHIPKAMSITETQIGNPNNTHGLMYEVGGDAASAIQFYLTDSTNHFVRMALYFYTPPNADSIAPVVDFIKEDIMHLIETWQWKQN